MRFRTLLFLSLILPLALTASAVTAVMYASADRHSAELAHKLLASITHQASQEMYAHSERAVGLVRAMEQMGPSGGLALNNPDALAPQLAGLLRAHPDVTWISFSNPEGTFTGAVRRGSDICVNRSHIVAGKTQMTEHRLDADNHPTLLREDADSGYDPRKRPFYTEARKAGELVWLPPYIFYEQSIPGISCAVPVYDANPDKKLLGVFSVDYDLNYLSELAGKLATSPQARVMVFTSDFVLLAHSSVRVAEVNGRRGDGVLLRSSDIKDPLTQALMQQLNPALLARTGKDGGAMNFDMNGSTQVACVLPQHMESGPLLYVAAVAPKSDFAPSPWESSRYAFLIVLAAFLLAGILAYFVARRVSAPVITLVQATEQIGAGDLDIVISLGTIREFRKLSAAFHAMLISLKDLVRVRTSLALTREIQRRLLPPVPPRIPGYDIAGYSASCDETGGDYFDYVHLTHPDQSGSLILVLGDMMGHGLPAALLMAGARGALRSTLRSSHSPATLLTHLNDVFHRDTDGKRFMTMCVAAFNLQTCDLVWASAGHDPPIIFDPQSNAFHEPDGGDLPLGIEEHVNYLDYHYGTPCAGQIFFLGSDGVWETYSPTREQFGKDRLKSLLAQHAHRSADEIKSEILFALDQFRGTAEIRDDVTFIILKLLPQPALLRRSLDVAPTGDQRIPAGRP